ncbi:MAG: DUF4157 domain-containing protein [bacterium]|nr:DUF4157 domain-containing protein [bacterium]
MSNEDKDLVQKSDINSDKSDSVRKKEDKNKKVRRKGTYQADADSDFLMKMHKTVGNQEVQRMIQNRVVQAKMTVGSPNDVYEKEADAVADKIVNMSDAQVQSKQNDESLVQAKGSPGGMDVPSGFESGLSSIKGTGSQLNKDVRGYYESRLNTYLGDVRVHTGNKADHLARSINAEAFTTGHDIVFAARNFDPSTQKGKKLLGHELTHVLQQKKGVQRKGKTPAVQAKGNGAPSYLRHYRNTRGEISEELIKNTAEYKSYLHPYYGAKPKEALLACQCILQELQMGRSVNWRKEASDYLDFARDYAASQKLHDEMKLAEIMFPDNDQIEVIGVNDKKINKKNNTNKKKNSDTSLGLHTPGSIIDSFGNVSLRLNVKQESALYEAFVAIFHKYYQSAMNNNKTGIEHTSEQIENRARGDLNKELNRNDLEKPKPLSKLREEEEKRRKKLLEDTGKAFLKEVLKIALPELLKNSSDGGTDLTNIIETVGGITGAVIYAVKADTVTLPLPTITIKLPGGPTLTIKGQASYHREKKVEPGADYRTILNSRPRVEGKISIGVTKKF